MCFILEDARQQRPISLALIAMLVYVVGSAIVQRSSGTGPRNPGDRRRADRPAVPRRFAVSPSCQGGCFKLIFTRDWELRVASDLRSVSGCCLQIVPLLWSSWSLLGLSEGHDKLMSVPGRQEATCKVKSSTIAALALCSRQD